MVKGSACPWPGSGKGQGERVWVPRVSAGLGDVLVELVVLLGGYLALRLGPDGLDLVRVRLGLGLGLALTLTLTLTRWPRPG